MGAISVGREGLPSGSGIFASVARTATPTAVEFNPDGCTGIVVIVDMTVDPGVDTVTFNIEGKDPASGKWYLLLASAALTDVATTPLVVHPAVPAVANLAAQKPVPEVVRVRPVHSGVTTTTYSVGVIGTV